MKIKITKSHSLIHPFYLRQRFTSRNKMKAGFGRQVTHLLFILCTLSFILVESCNTTEPGNGNNLTLSVEDVSSTEAWLKLETENISLPVKITLLQNNNVGQVINLSKIDTTIYVDSLLPNKTYTFQTSGIGNQASGFKSNKVNVTTLDTTSNNFTWQTWTFGGDAGSSYLNDVAIVNDTSIWAVGAIYLKDSTGQPDPEQYAIAHWNGREWKLTKLRYNCRLYYPNCGPETRLIVSGSSIFARSKDDIWIAAGSVHHFNGKKWSEEAGILGAGNANKIWGNENELWFVGNNGFIAHRSTNGSWQKIESGTDLQFLDIFGAEDTEGEQQILAVCTQNYPPGKGVYKIHGNTAEEISSNIPKEQIAELFGIWFKPYRHYYIVGDGVYEKRLLTDSTWKNGPLDITRYATTKIRGSGLNNIFVVGAFGEFLHFNGFRWKSFRNKTALGNGSYSSVALTKNLIIAVGTNNASAVITMGRK